MANNKNFIAKNGVSTGDGYAMPTTRTNLLFDFKNSQTLDPRLSFTRGTVGHYYDGKSTFKADENLLQYSQTLSNAYWADNLCTQGSSTTAPDGTTTATPYTVNSGTSVTPYVAFAAGTNWLINTTTYTASIYAKAGTHNYIQGCVNAFTTMYVNFDLSTGAVGTSNDGTGTITDVGGGWYRCTWTYTTNSTTASPFVAIVSSSSAGRRASWSPAGTETFTLWGFQLEQRSSATAYIPTTNTLIVKYQPTLVQAAINEARFNHFPTTGEPRGLLLEDGRTNYARYSETFGTGTWNYSANVSVLDNVQFAPNGTQTADLLIADTTNATHYLGIASSLSSGTQKETFSVYAKAYGVNRMRFYLANQVGNYSQNFNLDTGTLGTSGSSNYQQAIEDCGNGWYRCSWTFLSTKTNPYPTIQLMDDSNNTTFTGDGFHGVLLWGGQWERSGGDGYFPTSYIYNNGNVETSRSADDLQLPVSYSATYFTPESTTYIEADSFGPLNVGTYRESTVCFYYNSSNWWDIGPNSWGSGNSINTYQYWNNIGQIVVSKTLPDAGDANVDGTPYKAAAVYAYNDYALTCAGNTTPVTDTAFNFIPMEYVILYLGSRYGSQRVNGHYKKFAYYPARLSNETLAQMTED